MPYTTEFSADGAGLLQHGSGTLTVDELIAVTIAVTDTGDRLVVIARLPAMFGMARMWEALSHRTGWRIMVVQTREEAVEWLRREVPHVVIA